MFKGQIYKIARCDVQFSYKIARCDVQFSYKIARCDVQFPLLLLKDLTKGEEERIFTYENDKQVWW